MPRTRSHRAESAALQISGLLLDIFRRRRRGRSSSSSDPEDLSGVSSEESSTSSSESSTSDSETDESSIPYRRGPYHTRARDRRNRNRNSQGSNHSSNSEHTEELEFEDESEGEEVRAESESVTMNNDDLNNSIQVIEDNRQNLPSQSNHRRSSSSDSDSELNTINRPKRRRTDNFATDDEEAKPGVSETASAAHAPVEDDSGDDGCTICYEEYTSAGEHRLASVKCGHFFGYSCIARWIRSEATGQIGELTNSEAVVDPLHSLRNCQFADLTDSEVDQADQVCCVPKLIDQKYRAGRNAVCPTCKTKTTIKDVRKHYTNAVKVTDTTEVEMLKNSNAALHIKISGLEVELARKDREISELRKKLQEGTPHDIISATPQLIVQPRGGRMFMNPERKESLINGSSNADARAMDFNGEVWAVGVACSQVRNIFSPYGIRMLTISRQDFKLRECYPLHSGRSRVVVFSPFESSLLLSGGEDKRALVSMNGAVRRQWKMPNEKPVWTGCWTSANKVALGLGDGRVFEYAVDSDSTEPIRDYTQGVGHLPIIFTGFDPSSSTLLVASFKKLIAFRNERVFPLLNNTDDQFDKMRSVSFDESSLHFAVTFSPGGRHPAISHRLYRLEVDDDNDEVRCVEMAQWLTECQMSSTMWSNCLFSLKNSLFSVVFNEDQRRFDAHDWSGRRTDAMIRFPSSATVATIRAVPTVSDSRKTIVVLADKALFSIAFGLSDAVS